MRTPGESETTADHAKQGSGSSSGRNVATSHHAGRTSLLRDRTDKRTATNVELFFDLVYVFAITQLSRTLLAAPTAHQALRSALLFAMVWLVWAYTTWVTNFLDPERLPVRALLVFLMLASLVMSVGIPGAFGSRGLAVGGAYAVMQIVRSGFAVLALRGQPLQRNFQRILSWCVLSGGLAIGGAVAHGGMRELLWVAAVTVDVVGGLVGFYTPGLGRSTTGEWTIDGSHFAERCQAFVLIALGESVVAIGSTLSGLSHIASRQVVAFICAFVGSVGLWWLYFDRSADRGARIIASSADPGRVGRSAYHLVHPIMISGIVLWAAADQRVLTLPAAAADPATAWLLLAGAGLFLTGQTAFVVIIDRADAGRRRSAPAATGSPTEAGTNARNYLIWPRTAAAVALLALGLAGSHLSRVTLDAAVVGVVILTVVWGHLHPSPSGRTPARRLTSEPAA